jgi:hypothetical protein
VPDGVIPRAGNLQSDLKQLAGLVSTDVPAYYLVRLDSSASEWLAISYVPDTAKVRDKVHHGAPFLLPTLLLDVFRLGWQYLPPPPW